MAFNPQEHFRKVNGNQDYLEVKWRLVWFRELCPNHGISTELVWHDAESKTAIFKAEIIEPMSGNVLSTAHGSECARDFKDYLEKAETKAIGRALAILGYGTQFAEELDEGDRIVDAPVEPKKKKTEKKAPDRSVAEQTPQETTGAAKKPIYTCTDCGQPIVDTKIGDTEVKADEILAVTFKKYHKYLCVDCARKAKEANKNA